jgi:hypothetical protein
LTELEGIPKRFSMPDKKKLSGSELSQRIPVIVKIFPFIL